MSREQAQANPHVARDDAVLRPDNPLLFADTDEAISHVRHPMSATADAPRLVGDRRGSLLDLMGDRSGWYAENLVAVRRVR